ncbi:hypothetical protein LTS10_002654 [Elasticomyces elasticus]|nr:hypothetical protein LTS10_002654 [Elasticomyces elasticus]
MSKSESKTSISLHEKAPHKDTLTAVHGAALLEQAHLYTGMLVFLSNYITVSISPILGLVATKFQASITEAGWLITVNLLFLGLGNLFWIPLSEKIGKRPVLVITSGLFFVSTVWAAVAKSYGSLLGARIAQGFAASVSEGIGPVIVGDLYFLHERGLWIGLNILLFTVGTSLGSIFSGLIATADVDPKWIWWHQVILTGSLFLTVLLFHAGTNFSRPLENESGEGLPASQLAGIRASVESSWYLVASVLGCFAGGPFTDWTVHFITKRRGGYFLPEFRLWCMIPPAVMAPVGLMLWGAGLQNHLPSMVPILGAAITYAILCSVPGITMTYVVDCYRPVSKETMTIITAAKNTFAFGFSFAVFPWIARDGLISVSGYQVLIEGVILLLTIPMYIYGSRLRVWTDRFMI